MKKSVTLILILFLLFNCDCAKQKYVYYVQDSFKTWTFFKKGSYWIYLNENNNTLDTNYVTADPDIYYYPDSPPQYEHIYVNLSSNFITNYHIDRVKEEENSFVAIGLDKISDGPYALSRLVTDGLSDQVSASCRLIKVYDNLTINGNKFYNVIQTQDSSTFNGDKKLILNYYFVKNIGLIKVESKVASADSIWSIVKWHIKQ